MVFRTGNRETLIKVRNREGLYAIPKNGKIYFTKHGKTWSSIGHFKNHLIQKCKNTYYSKHTIDSLRFKYDGCVVETIYLYDDYVCRNEEPIEVYLQILEERKEKWQNSRNQLRRK